METYNRICLEDYSVEGEVEGTKKLATVSLKRGKEYTTSKEREGGTVIVFTSYWLSVPVSIFGGAVQFTK